MLNAAADLYNIRSSEQNVCAYHKFCGLHPEMGVRIKMTHLVLSESCRVIVTSHRGTYGLK